MKLYIYHKTVEDISVFDEIMSLYAQEADDVQILSENRRSYRGLEQLLLEIDSGRIGLVFAGSYNRRYLE